MENKKIEVMNRSSGSVVYSVPDLNIRRYLAPGESITVTADEIEKLSFQPGGKRLIANYLLVKDSAILSDINIETQPEYNMTAEDVAKLLTTGSLDEFLDALDFAPEGVIDMIKTLSVSLPLMDMNKRKAIKEKVGFDVDEAIRHTNEATAPEAGDAVEPAKPAVTRRTNGSKYKVVEKK